MSTSQVLDFYLDQHHLCALKKQTNTWESVLDLKNKLKQKGWFVSPPRKSMLRLQPACAWFTAGKSANSQQSKFLPALHKDVLRKALQRWIEVHFYLPVAGNDPNNNNQHVNLMEMFVTYVWGYYTQHQEPKVPALTDVGRFTFTYIWRSQHALFRYFFTLTSCSNSACAVANCFLAIHGCV